MEQKEVIHKLNMAYQNKRKNAQLFADQMKEKVLENKDYYVLELKERNLILDLSKLSFEQKPTKQTKTELNDVRAQKDLILKKLNIKKEALTPQYECAFCHDTGKVNGDYCICFKQAINNVLMQESQINFSNYPSLNAYEIELFEESHKTRMLKVLETTRKIVAAFPNSKIKNLIFSGATGVGKTYLSKVIAKEVIEKGYTTYFTTAFSLNATMLKYHTTFDESKEEILNSVLHSDLLIIDDLGTEPILKNVTLEYLLLILNERFEKEKSTIINTNLGPEHILDRYGERIFSRLMNKQNSLLIYIDGLDLRLKKQTSIFYKGIIT